MKRSMKVCACEVTRSERWDALESTDVPSKDLEKVSLVLSDVRLKEWNTYK